MGSAGRAGYWGIAEGDVVVTTVPVGELVKLIVRVESTGEAAIDSDAG